MQRIIQLYGVFLLLFTFSCGGGESESETVNFEDFAGQTGQEKVDTIAVDSIPVPEDHSQMGELIQKLIPDYDTSGHKAFNVLDRFSFNQNRKVQFIGREKVAYGKSKEVTPLANVFYYTFSDTLKTKNAFYNYLDGMAAEGEGGPVKLHQDVKSIKMPPLFMVVYDTVIVSAEYMCEHKANDWKAFEDSIFAVFGKKYRYCIDVGCGGPLKWK
ncbi:MAG: hypothetical protein WDZ35_08730 [Crocinitomicaceae bacterium]